MATITVKRIKGQYLLSYDDFEWLKERLNKPLPLFSITYSLDGSISHVAIRKNETDIITLFDSNQAVYTIEGADTHANRNV
jgi:hypothetical protein